MDNKPKTMAAGRPSTLPRMTRAEWNNRDRTSVTLTRGELEHLAQLAAIGRGVLRDVRPLSPRLKAAMSRLKAAMSRLKVSTAGL